MDDDGDLHEQILHIEARIEELTDATERCRKIILISKVAIAAGGILILATSIGAVGSDATVLIWGDCSYHRRDSRFWIKHEHFEANYERHESRRGIPDRVDQ
jgi:hypothetical protein